jgi:hypothetical protein
MASFCQALGILMKDIWYMVMLPTLPQFWELVGSLVTGLTAHSTHFSRDSRPRTHSFFCNSRDSKILLWKILTACKYKMLLSDYTIVMRYEIFLFFSYTCHKVWDFRRQKFDDKYRVFHNECPNFKTLYFCNHEPQINETCSTWTALA